MNRLLISITIVVCAQVLLTQHWQIAFMASGEILTAESNTHQSTSAENALSLQEQIESLKGVS